VKVGTNMDIRGTG